MLEFLIGQDALDMQPAQLLNQIRNAVLERFLCIGFRCFRRSGRIFPQRLVAGKAERVCLSVGGTAVRAGNFFNNVGRFTLPPTSEAIVQGIGILRPANALPLRLRLWLRSKAHGFVCFRGGPGPIGTESHHQQADNAREKAPGKAAVISLGGGYIGADGPKDNALNSISDQRYQLILFSFGLCPAWGSSVSIRRYPLSS